MNTISTSHPSRRGDRGMTLIELLISVAVLGAIVTVLASAVIVTLRQDRDTRARLDVARWEQSLALWLPTDLSSATTVSADKSDVPCTTGDPCDFGSNALQLTWNDGTGETTVSYRYGPASDGESFELHRVVCKAGSCTRQIVLRDLAVPADDDGNPIAWAAGDEVPDTVINVTVPLAVGSSSSASCDPLASPPDPDCDNDTRAQRVIVNVNGTPGGDGVDRSSTVSFTAGGSSLTNLEPATFTGPSFLQANSGCGGPITLIVDRSASLSPSDFANIRTGVREFVNTFEGTPTRLQIVTFGTVSNVLGDADGNGKDWNEYFDLADPADVELLMGPSGTSGYISDIVAFASNSDAATNWDDALHRTFFTETGTPHSDAGNPAAPMPELVVFFTDGEPTRWRYTDKSDSSSVGPTSYPSRFAWYTAGNTNYGADFTPGGWYGADFIVDQFRDIRMIGVGVGQAFNENRWVWRSGWPGSSIPKEVFLGDLVAGGDPSQHGSSASGSYVKREWNSTDGWGDVSNANLLVTDQWDKFDDALTEIALAECGGTLTVQTRDTAGSPAEPAVTYQVGDEVVTTNRIVKAAPFDIPLNGIPSATVDLIPQSFAGTGLTPLDWNCRAGGADLTEGSDWQLITPGVPADGISITVTATSAVSCILEVST